MGEGTFFGHPRALSTLFFVEMWERFSYYGMAAILVLYLADSPSRGGAGLPDAQAASIYALYVAVVYVVSLPGGWLADRVLGAKRAVLLGGTVIALGHFTMAVGGLESVIAGLGIIVVGTGLLKPNTVTMVGDLYAGDDPKRDAGFSLYYMSINVGAFFSPLICGSLASAFSWKVGFAAAGVGMTAGLIHYVLDWHGLGEVGETVRRPLPSEARRGYVLAAVGAVAGLAALAVVLFGVLRLSMDSVEQGLTWALVVLPLGYFVYLLARGAKPGVERHRLGALFILFLATAAWFAVVSQAGSILNLFAEEDTQRQLLGFTIPAAWFQSINPICIVLFAPPLAWLWQHLGTRQPSTPAKFIVALLLVAASMGMMVVASRFAPLDGTATTLVSPLWLVGVFVVQTLGELLISPIGLNVATRLAPPESVSQIMGVWMLAFAVGAAISGVLADLYGVIPLPTYYGLLGAVLLAVAIALLLLIRPLKRLMEGVP